MGNKQRDVFNSLEKKEGIQQKKGNSEKLPFKILIPEMTFYS